MSKEIQLEISEIVRVDENSVFPSFFLLLFYFAYREELKREKEH